MVGLVVVVVVVVGFVVDEVEEEVVVVVVGSFEIELRREEGLEVEWLWEVVDVPLAFAFAFPVAVAFAFAFWVVLPPFAPSVVEVPGIAPKDCSKGLGSSAKVFEARAEEKETTDPGGRKKVRMKKEEEEQTRVKSRTDHFSPNQAEWSVCCWLKQWQHQHRWRQSHWWWWWL